METNSYISDNRSYTHVSDARITFDVGAYRRKERAERIRRSFFLPLLAVVFIFNGSHDPKKVSWLNITLTLGFFAWGSFFDPELLFLGVLFTGITFLNVASVWAVKKFGNGRRTPAANEILSLVHISFRNTDGRKQTREGTDLPAELAYQNDRAPLHDE